MVSRCGPLRFWELWPSLLSKNTSVIPFHPLTDNRFDLHLDARIEYLTLAVANAKSHPISIGGRHETAIAFLTDLEEKLDVAQVQLEIYNTLLPHVNDAPEVGERIKSLSTQLFTMTDVS
jgi:nuclear pore complex protein Nup155